MAWSLKQRLIIDFIERVEEAAEDMDRKCEHCSEADHLQRAFQKIAEEELADEQT